MNDPADNNWEPSRLELEQHDKIVSLTSENFTLRERIAVLERALGAVHAAVGKAVCDAQRQPARDYDPHSCHCKQCKPDRSIELVGGALVHVQIFHVCPLCGQRTPVSIQYSRRGKYYYAVVRYK